MITGRRPVSRNPWAFCVLMVCALLLSGAQKSVPAQGKDQNGAVQKVILEAGELETDRPGISLWHDYGSFALYRVTDEALRGLTAEGFAQAGDTSDELDMIYIDAYPFNSQTTGLDLPEPLSLEEPVGPALQLVQFVGPIKAEWLANLEAAGAVPVHYIANNAYLVWASSQARSQLSSMVKGGDFLQYSAPYQPYFKLGPTLRERVTTLNDSEAVVRVVIQIYRHAGSGASEEAIKRASIEQLAAWEPVLAFQTTIVTMRIADVAAISKLPDVFWIGERLERELLDEVQGQILAGELDASQTGPSAPGYLAWLDGYGFSQDPDDYPVVDVVDDGIGSGNVNSGDSTLHRLGLSGDITRLQYIENCTQEINGGGPDGHGHINASIVGGYDNRSEAVYNDLDGFNLGLGINPYGRLAGTRIFGQSFDISGCGGQDSVVIRRSYTNGGRISSNSWGCSGCAGTYDESSQAYDVGTRDAVADQAGNQQLIFVFAAGNSGPGSSTVNSPGNAKNVITVGASESDRPTWTDGCVVPPSGADDAMDMVDFSSRGPAPGGRVKPEMVAPGTHIQGTASTHPGYTGLSVCDRYQPEDQIIFAASSGTSHSTPAVSGVASLYYYWLEQTYGFTTPSPALMKAYLIAHPTYLIGEDANDDLPSQAQGFGMPNMSLGLNDTARFLVDQSVVFNNSGETWIFEGGVSDSTEPVRIVLAYTDQAGAIGTSPQVNDLNLKVEVGGGTYLGNQFSGAWSVTGGTADAKNNYEAVFLPPGTSGTLIVTITGFNVAGDGVPNFGDGTDQDFALVCYNCAQLSADPSNQQLCTLDSRDAIFDVSIGQIPGSDAPVTLSASGQPPGSSLAFLPNPITPPGTSVMTISNIGSGQEGSYTLAITATSEQIQLTANAGLALFDRLPDSPNPVGPANDAIDQPVRPVFTWQPVSQAGVYEIEIATDAQFSNVVASAMNIHEEQYIPSIGLNSASTYYWRVRASNACGAGNYSPTSQFSTLLLPGDCPVNNLPLTVYHEDFESGAAGWSRAGVPAGVETWQLSESQTYHGDFAYWAEDITGVGDQWLISPSIALPEDRDPLFLEFWNYQSIERNASSTMPVCFDGAILELSLDEGQTWVQVQEPELLANPYHALVSEDHDNPLGGLPAWCGDPQDWTSTIVDLAAYAGQAVQFRFRLGTDSSVGREGWYIDDVSVMGCQENTGTGGVGISAAQAGEGRPGREVHYTFTITNQGDFADTYHLEATSTWEAEVSPANTAVLQPGEASTVELIVTVPKEAQDGEAAATLLRATSNSVLHVEAISQASTTARWWRSYYAFIANFPLSPGAASR